jgi:hypothetical protein
LLYANCGQRLIQVPPTGVMLVMPVANVPRTMTSPLDRYRPRGIPTTAWEMSSARVRG